MQPEHAPQNSSSHSPSGLSDRERYLTALFQQLRTSLDSLSESCAESLKPHWEQLAIISAEDRKLHENLLAAVTAYSAQIEAWKQFASGLSPRLEELTGFVKAFAAESQQVHQELLLLRSERQAIQRELEEVQRERRQAQQDREQYQALRTQLLEDVRVLSSQIEDLNKYAQP